MSTMSTVDLLVHSETAFFSRLLDKLRAIVRVWAERRRQRAELVDYLSYDHRAAADMGSTQYELEDWANKPFWRD